jgi:opacity protein-like surface antigen
MNIASILKTTKIIIIINIFVVIAKPIMAQKVSIGKTIQIEQRMVLDYVISGFHAHQEFDVSLMVSRDDGLTYNLVPIEELSGDVGGGIKGGKRSLIWTMPYLSEKLRFEVRARIAEVSLRKSIFMQYVANQFTPFGFRAGILRRYGCFGEVRFSPAINKKAQDTFTGNKLDNFNQPGYYSFSGKTATPSFSALLGFTYNFWRYTHLYLGAGYGFRRSLAEVSFYQYNNNNPTHSSWAESNTDSFSGPEIDLGTMGQFGNFVWSGGLTLLDFTKTNFTIGLGYKF